MSDTGTFDDLNADHLDHLDDRGDLDDSVQWLDEPMTAQERAETMVDRDVSAELSQVMEGLRMSRFDDSEDDSHADVSARTSRSDAERYLQLEHDILARVPEHHVQPSLERIQMAMSILGDPQRSYRSVHITGTNGKTSTARMISALLTQSGRKVGRYTSPHLTQMRERICIDDEPVSIPQFTAMVDDVAPYIDIVDRYSRDHGGVRMSFFEVLTVVALAGFADVPVDVAVIEVGMGGRWDATNVIDAQVVVLTPIARDHERWLGADVVDIAREKVGIISEGATVICAEQDPEVLEVIEQACREKDAQLRLLGRDIDIVDRRVAVGGQMISVQTLAATYSDVYVPLLGPHQATNAALAIAAVEAFNSGRVLDVDIVEDGMRHATSPGRLEVVRTSPSIVVDAAHNPHGAEALRTALEDSFDYTSVVGVFSAMADKDVEAVLTAMEPVLDHLVVTALDSTRAMELDDLAEIARDVFGEDRVDVERHLVDAIDRAVERSDAMAETAQSAGVVIFGSVVLAGAARDLIGGHHHG